MYIKRWDMGIFNYLQEYLAFIKWIEKADAKLLNMCGDNIKYPTGDDGIKIVKGDLNEGAYEKLCRLHTNFYIDRTSKSGKRKLSKNYISPKKYFLKDFSFPS